MEEGNSKRAQDAIDLERRTLALEHYRGVFTHLMTSTDINAVTSLARLRCGATISGEYARIQDTLPAAQDVAAGAILTQRQRVKVDEDAQLSAQNHRLVDMMRGAGYAMPDDLTMPPNDQTEGANAEALDSENEENEEIAEAEETGGGVRLGDFEMDDAALSNLDFPPGPGADQLGGDDLGPSPWDPETGAYNRTNVNPALLEQRAFGPPPPESQYRAGPPPSRPSSDQAGESSAAPRKKRARDPENT